VLAALTWIWQGEGASALGPWVLVASILFFLVGWIAATVSEDDKQRLIAWIAGVGGLGLMTAASASNAPAGLAFSGAVMALAGTLGIGLHLGSLGTRAGAVAAAAISVGIPGLVGALWLGVLVPAGSPSPFGWAGVVGLGLISSSFLWQVFRPRDSEREGSRPGYAAVAAALVGVVAVLLYVRLKPVVTDPALPALLVSSSVALTVSLITWRIPARRRTRMARALRWPSAMRRTGESFGPTATAGGFVRGIRDILEGDASLLWALVVVVVGLLLLQGVA
jgi:hypothetical protein